MIGAVVDEALKEMENTIQKSRKNLILGGGACCRLSLPVCGRGNGEGA